MFLAAISFLKILAICAIIKSLEAKINPETYNFTNDMIAKSLMDLSEANVGRSEQTQFIYVHFNQSRMRRKFFFADMVTFLLDDVNYSTRNIYFHQPIVFSPYSHFELVLVDDISSLRYLYQNLIMVGTRNLHYTVIHISRLHNPNDNDTQTILDMMWEMNILNVVLVMQRYNLELVLVSYFPFSAEGCRSVRPVIINSFNITEGHWQSKNMFPTKTNNFYGCQLIAAGWKNMPFLLLEADDKGDVKYLDGFEGELLLFMSQNLNFSIGIHVLTDEEVVETYNKSGAIFEKIFTDYADFAVGSFHYDPNLENLVPYSQTVYYYLSHIRLLTNAFKYSAYEKIAHPFSLSVWIVIGCVYLAGFGVIFVCNRLKPCQRDFVLGFKNWAPYHNMFILSMGAVSAMRVPGRNFARFLIVLWVVITLIIREAYESGLYHMLRGNSFYPPPETIRAVIDLNYNIYISKQDVDVLNNVDELIEVKFLTRTEVEVFHLVADSPRRVAVITPFEYYGYFLKRNSSSSWRLHIVNERIFVQPLAFYVRKNSYLVNELNRQILLAQTTGLLEMWSKRHMELENEDNDVYEIATEEINALSVEELEAIFVMHLSLLACSTFCFLIEIVYNLKAKMSFYYYYKKARVCRV